MSDCLFDKERIAAVKEVRFPHPHNRDAVRFTRSLGDAVGLQDMGVHWVRVPPGGQSSEHHSHEVDEEFVLILSGRGLSDVGEDSREVGPGDLLIFPRNSPAHALRNPFDEDLVFLAAGTRSKIDICNYPRKGIRQYRIDGVREYVRREDLRQPPPLPA